MTIEVKINQPPRTPIIHRGDERYVCIVTEADIRNLAEQDLACEIGITASRSEAEELLRVDAYIKGVIQEVDGDRALNNEPPAVLPPLEIK
jgi:hypothetical protein